MTLKADILSMLDQYEGTLRLEDQRAYISELYQLINELRVREDKAEKRIFESKPKFLPADVREEIECELIDSSAESRDCDCDCGILVTDYFSDEELLNEYEEMIPTPEEDELYQKGLGYKAEYEMLSQKPK